MNARENLLSLMRRQGFETMPCEFNLCPSLEEEYKKRTGATDGYWDYFQFPWRNVEDIRLTDRSTEKYEAYYPDGLKEGTGIDSFGVAHEPGSEAAKHMTYMRHPLVRATKVSDIERYPFPDFAHGSTAHQKPAVEKIHARGLAAVGNMPCTVWETAWYIRSMEELMMDMISEDEKADVMLDKVTELSVCRAVAYAKAGVDILYLGDDIGMQRTPMMSLDLYEAYVKPRLKRVIDAAKAVNPELIVFYHSCGHATPFIPKLIEVGVDVLNPIQPESMDIKEIYNKYGDRISFHGAIGTQTTMPFGTPEEVRQTVHDVLNMAGKKGGILAAPTHLLEPEVPWENVMAYVEACRDYHA